MSSSSPFEPDDPIEQAIEHCASEIVARIGEIYNIETFYKLFAGMIFFDLEVDTLLSSMTDDQFDRTARRAVEISEGMRRAREMIEREFRGQAQDQ